jgi:spore maturation protein SpmA
MLDYLHYSLERAVKTVAQTAVSVILASQVIDIVSVDWLGVLSVSALAGVLSLLTSVANYKSGKEESPDGDSI